MIVILDKHKKMEYECIKQNTEAISDYYLIYNGFAFEKKVS